MELRQEQDQLIENLQKQVEHVEEIAHQANDFDDVHTLDQTYEVMQWFFS